MMIALTTTAREMTLSLLFEIYRVNWLEGSPKFTERRPGRWEAAK